MKSIIVLKAVTISMMIVSVITMITTVIFNEMGWFGYDVMNYHMSAGILFLSVIPIHVYMMRQKLKKLSEQIYIMSMTGVYRSTCSSQVLPSVLKKKSLAEFCSFIDMEIQKASVQLSLNKIKVHDTKMSIEKIAEENRVDSSKLFSILLERYVWNSIPLPAERSQSMRMAV